MIALWIMLLMMTVRIVIRMEDMCVARWIISGSVVRWMISMGIMLRMMTVGIVIRMVAERVA